MKFLMIYKPLLMSVFISLITFPSYANFSWTFDNNPVQGTCEAPSVGNKCTQSDTDAGKTIGVTATAWATSTNSISSALEQATLKRWDGLAVNSVGESTSSPQHATDNDGKFEAVLFQFDEGITLTSITMGWHNDADFALLRHSGSGDASLSGKSMGNLTGIANGWELVGNYTYSSGFNADTDITASVEGSSPDNFTGPLDENGSTKTLNADLSSSYWLVAALNGAFWNNSNYVGNDYFKVKNLTGTVSAASPAPGGSVPEPSTLILMSVAFAGIRMRRSKSDIG